MGRLGILRTFGGSRHSFRRDWVRRDLSKGRTDRQDPAFVRA